MKYKFVVDENIISHGVLGVDKHNSEDITAAHFLALVALNCHTIVKGKQINRDYIKRLEILKGEVNKKPINSYIMVASLLELHGSKIVTDFSDFPPLQNEQGIPAKDIHIVRTAKNFDAIIVTSDQELLDAVNGLASLKELGLKALTPREAIELAKDS